MEIDSPQFRKHEVHRPEANEWRGWLRPKPGAQIVAGPHRVDVLQAIDSYALPDEIPGIFGCLTPYGEWAAAYAAKCHLKFMREHGATPRGRQELKRLALQATRRRQKFDRALVRWADCYGLLGVGDAEGDYIPDVFEDTVRGLRAWAHPESEIWHAPHGEGELIEESVTPEYLATGWPPPVYIGKGPTPDWERLVNEQAQLCTRSLKGEWSAPTLLAAMCHVVRNADMLGIRFAMCSAEDCFNPYVASHGKREHCSKRCANRARAQRLRLEQTLRE